MCFSAGASFTASAVVATAGVISIAGVKKKTQLMFASIPVIFALQQLVEGFVWFSFTDENYRSWQNMLVMSFLFIAQVVWPLWVPLAILQTETERRRRTALKVLVLISCIVAPLQAYRLFFYPATAELSPHHIHYALDFSIPYFGLALNVFYFMSTMFPPFLSSRRPILVLGFLNLTSFLITVVLFEKNVVSIWCFFAALISWQVIRGIKDINRQPGLAL
jgi:hypothetical protein